jgi:hypothetical protein
VLLVAIALRVAYGRVRSAAGPPSSVSLWTDRQLQGDRFEGADVGSGSGCDDRPFGLTAGEPTSEVRCSEAVARERVIPTIGCHSSSATGRLEGASGIALGTAFRFRNGCRTRLLANLARGDAGSRMPSAPVSASELPAMACRGMKTVDRETTQGRAARRSAHLETQEGHCSRSSTLCIGLGEQALETRPSSSNARCDSVEHGGSREWH